MAPTSSPTIAASPVSPGFVIGSRVETESSLQAALKSCIRSTEWLIGALRAARKVDAPDWWIGAGAIRTAVWDRLHGFERPTPVADIDLIFFDPGDLSAQRDRQIAAALNEALPDVSWDAKNQAAVHLWFPRKFGYAVEPFTAAADAVATWPETATCVAVRLTAEDQLIVHAPLGLDDLFGMIHRRNPARVTVAEYERRLTSKRIAQRRPRVRIVPA
jgi:hypothetical protein